MNLDGRYINPGRAASTAINLLIALTLLISSVRAASGALDVGRSD